MIHRQRSIIPALDVTDPDTAASIVRKTAPYGVIGGYKIGFGLALSLGLERAVELVRNYTDKPVIYDHQKGGTDIPDTGKLFARIMKNAGVNAAILFPLTGPIVQGWWTTALIEEGIAVIIGGMMTHKSFLSEDEGYLDSRSPLWIYRQAAVAGVSRFVLPGNNPSAITRCREVIEKACPKAEYFSPGLVSQGGSIRKSGEAAGERWHCIIGRAIYEAADYAKAVEELSVEL